MHEIGFGSFDGRMALFAMARRILMSRLLVDDIDPAVAGLLAAEVLPEVERIERGLHQTARASDLNRDEARAYAIRAGISAPAMPWTTAGVIASTERRLEAELRPRVVEPAKVWDLEAAAHAVIILSLVPQVPPAFVSWPFSRATYRDLTRPDSLGTQVDRFERMERTIWHLAAGDKPRFMPDARLTFAFFDASVWMESLDPGVAP
jgi:hypothetical protein